jgi:uncharacterized membrane protein
MFSSQQVVRYLPFALPIITIAVALPLAMQKVPPNWWYGFRTRKTLSDSTIWYRANYLGGLDLLYSGIIALVANAIIGATVNPILALPIQSAVMITSAVVALVLWSVQMREL